jgi:hypothetical protein
LENNPNVSKEMIERKREMKALYYNLIMISALFIIISPAFSNYEAIELYIYCDDFKKHTRPLVMFPHMIHGECMDCIDCHHEYDEFGENVGGDGGFCSDCHTNSAKENQITLTEAFHIQCKQCHAEKVGENKNKNIPQMCGQCHVKEKE